MSEFQKGQEANGWKAVTAETPLPLEVVALRRTGGEPVFAYLSMEGRWLDAASHTLVDSSHEPVAWYRLPPLPEGWVEEARGRRNLSRVIFGF